MKILSFFIVFFISVSSNLIAEIPSYLIPGEQFEFKHTCSHYKNQVKLQNVQSVLQKRSYDVISYSIFMDWTNPLSRTISTGDARYYWGYNKVKLVIDTVKTQSIVFDAMDILIDSVIDVTTKQKIEVIQIQDIFNVKFPNYKFKGDTAEIQIFYSYVGKNNRGFYLIDSGLYVGQGAPPKRDSIFTLERLAYTMSEPEDARYWVPCNDSPYDKAYVEMKVSVPIGYNVASNGLLAEQFNEHQSSIFTFKSQYPMTTYLMVANASKFDFQTAHYNRVSDTTIRVPIEYYVWKDDWTSDTTDGGAYNAEYSFRNVPKMMEAYSKLYGEYPYEKYGMVVIQPFYFGGMEHQTLSSINRSWLRGWSETGIAHELAHQWLGDLITCATWFDIWINEGGATWSEAIWVASYTNKDTYYAYMNNVISKYYNNPVLHNFSIYGQPTNSIFSNPIYLLEYNKASWVYNMLREFLGDDVFFPALRAMLDNYKFTSIETVDFMNFFKENVPSDLIDYDAFFEQWIIKAGHPIFEVQTSTYDIGDKFEIKIDIKQVQEGTNIPEVFVTPIEFLVYRGSILDPKVLKMDKREQEFSFELDYRPDSIKVNTNKLICSVNSNLMSINSNENNSLNSAYPNPIKLGGIINFAFNNITTGIANIEVVDILGNVYFSKTEPNLQNSNYFFQLETSNYPKGNYFVKFNQNGSTLILKFVVVE